MGYQAVLVQARADAVVIAIGGSLAPETRGGQGLSSEPALASTSPGRQALRPRPRARRRPPSAA
jgi:hypothetical protein